MNIGGSYPSAQRPFYHLIWSRNRRIYDTYIYRLRGQTDEYMGPVKVKPDGPYVHRWHALTDKYNLIFIGFEIDECNLNIFIVTDEYIITDEWTLVFCSVSYFATVNSTILLQCPVILWFCQLFCYNELINFYYSTYPFLILSVILVQWTQSFLI
jgi:hypothetical protein